MITFVFVKQFRSQRHKTRALRGAKMVDNGCHWIDRIYFLKALANYHEADNETDKLHPYHDIYCHIATETPTITASGQVMTEYLKFRPLLPPYLPLLVSKHSSQNLTARTLRNHIDKFHPSTQPLMLSFVLLNMLLNITDQHAVILFQAHRSRFDNESFRELSSSVIRYRDDGSIIDSEMGQ